MSYFEEPLGDNPKYPCGVCKKTIAKNHKAIRCNVCNYKVHIKCNKTDATDFKKMNEEDAILCIICKEEIIPFQRLTDQQFYVTSFKGVNKDVDSLNQSLFPSTSLKTFFQGINDLNQNVDNDLDNEEGIPQINCKYVDIDTFKHKNKKEDFSLFHLNIASLAKHKEELETLLALLGYNFDIIGITETKLMKDSPPIIDINFNGYNCYHTPTESTKGGAMLYIQEEVNCKPRVDLDKIVYKSKELESVFIEIINPGRKNIVIGCIYRHPSMELEEFNDEFLSVLMENIGKEEKNIFLLGDFNVDLMNSFDNPTAQFFDTITSNMIVPHITCPTRVTTTTSTLIDNIFSNSLNFFDGISGNLTSKISDHYAQFLIIPKNCHKILTKHNLYKRDTKNVDRENFILDLLGIDWQETIDIEKDNPNHSFNQFETKLNKLIDKYMPIKKLTKSEIKQQLKPWITLGIRNSMRRRDKIYRKYLKAKNDQLKEEYHQKYKELRNQIVSLCRASKNIHFQRFFTENANNAKNTWQGIKSIINIRNSSKSSPTTLLAGNKIVSEPTEIANNFNNYFSTIAKKLQDNIHDCGKNYKTFLKDKNEKSIFINPTDSEEIITIINDLNTSKATGPHRGGQVLLDQTPAKKVVGV